MPAGLRWHTARPGGVTPPGEHGGVTWWLEIVPQLARGAAWIEVVTG